MGLWRQIVNLVIRPQRHYYSIEHMLGPNRFQLRGRPYKRTDFELRNRRGLTIQCSHFEPLDSVRPATKMPCVVYCHGNCGSRADAFECIELLIPYDVTVFCMDFTGSGLSDGDYVSLGAFEQQDLGDVVEHLRASGTVSRIGLWGRSMGAATALLFASTDPSIAGAVFDSCFTSIWSIARELSTQLRIKIPKILVNAVIKLLRRSIKKRAKFDLKKVNPLEACEHCFVPAIFCHANDDELVSPSHVTRLHGAYVGDKTLLRFEGDHNSARPEEFHDAVAMFFYRVLDVAQLGKDEEERTATPSTAKKTRSFTESLAVTTQQPYASMDRNSPRLTLGAEFAFTGNELDVPPSPMVGPVLFADDDGAVEMPPSVTTPGGSSTGSSSAVPTPSGDAATTPCTGEDRTGEALISKIGDAPELIGKLTTVVNASPIGRDEFEHRRTFVGLDEDAAHPSTPPS